MTKQKPLEKWIRWKAAVRRELRKLDWNEKAIQTICWESFEDIHYLQHSPKRTASLEDDAARRSLL